SDKLFKCGAGLTSYYVDPFGALSPCLMTTQHRWETEPGGFERTWNDDVGDIRERKPSRSDYECNSCEKQSLCTGCPAFNFLETGEEDRKSEYVCATTQARWSALFGDQTPAEVDFEYEQTKAGSHPSLPILK
ncbi:MAG: SPASM domain-containing protein, partial [Myxococcota bacterium]